MTRLIDAEQCPCYKCGATCPYNHPLDDCKKFSCWILGTVYDVDKVVEDIKAKSMMFVDPWVSYEFQRWAIDIVERGGINEDYIK